MNNHDFKILIIGPSWVGDTVMAQSLFKFLKQTNPAVSINVMAPSWTFSLLSRMKEVAEAIPLPLGHGELGLLKRYQLAQDLRKKNYDQAIILPNSFKAALIPWLSRIPQRTGYAREGRQILLNDVRYLNKQRDSLMIEQYLRLGMPRFYTEALPKPYLYPTLSVSKTSQNETLARYQPLHRGRPILALAPGGEFGPSKRWPFDYFARIAQSKINDGWDVWLFGSPKDRGITEKILSLCHGGIEDLAGRTTLSETIDLISLSDGLVSNDSGLMHIAAALNKPVIALYGSTSPKFTPPLSKNASILQLQLDCQPCFERTCPLKHHRCMQDLKPEQVLSHIAQWRIL